MNIKIFTVEELELFSVEDLMSMSGEIDSYVRIINRIRRLKQDTLKGSTQERFEKSIEIIRAWMGEEE